MPPAVFEPVIPVRERPQTHVSDCADIRLFIRDIPTESNLCFLFIILKNPKLRNSFVLPQVHIFPQTRVILISLHVTLISHDKSTFRRRHLSLLLSNVGSLFLVGPPDYVRRKSARKYFHPTGTFPGNSVIDILL